MTVQHARTKGPRMTADAHAAIEARYPARPELK
jgi:hypothetical protein